MEFHVLGPVEIRVGEQALDAGHARQRAVLAVLLLDLNRVVPIERLIDRVWGEDPPPSARNILYGHIARLRAMVASAADDGITLSRHQGGYRLHADPEQLDLHRFRRLASHAASAADDEAAERLLREALGLCHGRALTGVESLWLNAMRDTLELERNAALLDLNDVRLRLGQHSALAAELASLAVATPADERLIGQLMLALYRCGRQADALRWYEQTRGYLADELGTDPAPLLRELHQQILQANPALAGVAPVASGKPETPVPRELPGDVAAFTGRTAELCELDRILLGEPDQASETRATAAVISAVSGTAGVGKTALGVHWAHHAADRFPEGQLYVNLRGYDPDQPVAAADALAGFLRSLGVPGLDIPADEAERATRYRSLLAGRRMLVMLDNAATVEQVRSLLPGHPGCRVIVTSRDSLTGLVARDGARRLDLDLLPLVDAVALLHELIGARVGTEPDAAAALAEQCARLPLALRITAELAAARPNVPLAELVAELSDQQRRLDLFSVGGDPRTAVRSVFSWSYYQLGIESALAFRLAGLHPGPDLDAFAVAALTKARVQQARQALDVLSRAHLVEPTSSTRFGMHDLLRAYAREHAGTADGDVVEARDALTRLFDYYWSAAAAAMDILVPAEADRRPRMPPSAAVVPTMTGEADARAWLDSERANLVAVLAHCAGHGWPGHAKGLAGTLFRYLIAGSHLPEARTIYSHALQVARQTNDPAEEARSLKGLGAIGIMNGHYREAADCYKAALECYQQCADRVGQATVLHNLGIIEQARHNLLAARAYYTKAIAIYEDAGDSLRGAHALADLACAETELGSYDKAAELFQRALPVLRDAKHEVHEAHALESIGDLELRRGQLSQAADSFGQTLAICRRIDHPAGIAGGLSGLGKVSVVKGEYSQAICYLREAVALYRQTGSQSRETVTLRSLAEALTGAGQSAAARSELTAALRLATGTGNTHQVASVHCDLAESYHSVDQDQQARQHWQQALALYTAIGAAEADDVRAALAALGRGDS
jgi:DNA-binding SARP family transcriptional activator